MKITTRCSTIGGKHNEQIYKTLTTLVVMVSLVATPMFAFGNKHKFNKLQENQHSRQKITNSSVL